MGGGERGGRKGREEGKMDGDKTKRVGMREGEGEGGERWRGGEKGVEEGEERQQAHYEMCVLADCFPCWASHPTIVFPYKSRKHNTQQFSGHTRACVCERVNSKTTPPFLRTSIYICQPTTTELPP